jgi:hypothetical protein
MYGPFLTDIGKYQVARQSTAVNLPVTIEPQMSHRMCGRRRTTISMARPLPD